MAGAKLASAGLFLSRECGELAKLTCHVILVIFGFSRDLYSGTGMVSVMGSKSSVSSTPQFTR